MNIEKPEKKESFVESPIVLHPELIVTNQDIERRLNGDEIPGDTIRIMSKKGFPNYHLNPETKILIIFETEYRDPYFLLKADSPLIEKFKERYEDNWG